MAAAKILEPRPDSVAVFQAMAAAGMKGTPWGRMDGTRDFPAQVDFLLFTAGFCYGYG